MVFTRQFSAFDRKNQVAANSPFHGFYVLFWIAVAFLILKMGADNWRRTGNALGTNEIMKYMFRRDGKQQPTMVKSSIADMSFKYWCCSSQIGPCVA